MFTTQYPAFSPMLPNIHQISCNECWNDSSLRCWETVQPLWCFSWWSWSCVGTGTRCRVQGCKFLQYVVQKNETQLVRVWAGDLFCHLHCREMTSLFEYKSVQCTHRPSKFTDIIQLSKDFYIMYFDFTARHDPCHMLFLSELLVMVWQCMPDWH